MRRIVETFHIGESGRFGKPSIAGLLAALFIVLAVVLAFTLPSGNASATLPTPTPDICAVTININDCFDRRYCSTVDRCIGCCQRLSGSDCATVCAYTPTPTPTSEAGLSVQGVGTPSSGPINAGQHFHYDVTVSNAYHPEPLQVYADVSTRNLVDLSVTASSGSCNVTVSPEGRGSGGCDLGWMDPGTGKTITIDADAQPLGFDPYLVMQVMPTPRSLPYWWEKVFTFAPTPTPADPVGGIAEAPIDNRSADARSNTRPLAGAGVAAAVFLAVGVLFGRRRYSVRRR